MSPVEETGSGLGAAGTGFLRTETPVLGRVGPASGDPWRYSLRQSLKTWGENLAVGAGLGAGRDCPPQPFVLLQVGQYVSRAEELKAIVSSSNRALLRQGASARELLRGRPSF